GVQEEGLIKHIGLSEVSVADIKKAEEYVEVVSVQNKYSQDYRKWEPVLEYCEQTGKAFIPWNPLNAGNLSNMQKIEHAATRLGVTPHQLALAWLLHHSPNNLLIPGTSSVRHLEENMDAEKIELNDELLEELS
ncbi:MAG TPA: aldo/keto reductase, partial [Puia sp.]|nr:aldo/keto reductase [Puia sp.]